VGFVVDRSRDIVRIVVSQDDIDLVRRNVESIQVRLAENPEHIIPARLLREVPAADTELPSPALATEGGGQQELDPREQSHTKAMNRLFQFDLMLLREAEDELDESLVLPYGTRAHVRFVHQAEPIFNQVWRRIRQLFLSRLAV
jgi:putative peptide zinc metalloprotease protein